MMNNIKAVSRLKEKMSSEDEIARETRTLLFRIINGRHVSERDSETDRQTDRQTHGAYS